MVAYKARFLGEQKTASSEQKMQKNLLPVTATRYSLLSTR
jgi:hypothetical protein